MSTTLSNATNLSNPTTFSNPTTTRNSAHIKHNARKYGGATEVKWDFSQPLDMQLTDIIVYQAEDIVSTNEPYDQRFYDNAFYQRADRIRREQTEERSLEQECEAIMFGRTREGYSAVVRVPFSPFVYVYSMFFNWKTHVNQFKTYVAERLKIPVDKIKIELETRKRLYGWVPQNVSTRDYSTQTFTIAKVFLPNEKALMALKNVIAPPVRKEAPVNKDTKSKKSFPQFYNAPKVYVGGREYRFEVWESRVSMTHKFSDLTGIIPSDWVRIERYTAAENFMSHAQIECVSRTKFCKPLAETGIAPLLIASFDGEMLSGRKMRDGNRSFPNALRPEDPVICIGTTLWRYGSDQYDRFVFCLNSVDPTLVPDTTVFTFTSEEALLAAWRDFIVLEADPDALIGYNIWGFDFKYFACRADRRYETQNDGEAAQEEEEDEDDSHLPAVPDIHYGTLREKTTVPFPLKRKAESSASSHPSEAEEDENESQTQVIESTQPTRFFRFSRLWAEKTDLIKSVFNSAAYGKRQSFRIDMNGRFIQDLMVYARRNLKLESYKLDHLSVEVLLDKKIKESIKYKNWQDYTEEEKTAYEKSKKIDMPAQLMFEKYEQGPAERARIAAYCARDCDLPITLCRKLQVFPGLVEMSRVTYTPLPQIINGGQQIKVFNLLVIFAHKEGFVMNNKPNIPFGKYEGATVLDPKVGFYDHMIAVLDFNSLYPSIIIAKNLCFSTYVTNPQYLDLPGVEYHHIQVSNRRHTFVTMNVHQGVLPKMEKHLLAARKAVKKQMKTCTPELYPVLDGKQLAFKVTCNSVYGFTGASKGMYSEPAIAESITATGRCMIERSRDFVLANYPGSGVLYGDSVASYTPLVIRNAKGEIRVMTIEELWKSLEYPYPDSKSPVSARPSDPHDGDKHYFPVTELQVWSDQGFTPIRNIMRHHVKKQMYRVCTFSGIVDVTEDHSLLKASGEACRPGDVSPEEELLHYEYPLHLFGGNGYVYVNRFKALGHFAGQSQFPALGTLFGYSRELRQLYFDGYCQGYGKSGPFVFDSASDAQKLYLLITSLGLDCMVQMTHQGQYCVALGEAASPFTVQTKSPIEYQGYVYDLTTENHHFQAGVGCMIVHNTDSIMIRFPTTMDEAGLKEVFRLGNEAAERITRMFQTDNEDTAINLEMEKAYGPFLLFGRKRYGALKYEEPNINSGKFDVKGIEMARRDWCKMTRLMEETCLKRIFRSRDVQGAVQYIQQQCQDIIDGKVSIDMFVMSKELKNNYKHPEREIHLNVVKKMALRNPGSEPRVGDRVPFVIVRTNKKVKFVSDQSEDPQYALEQNIPLDYLYYIQRQLCKPLERLFSALIPDPKILFADAIRNISNEYDGYSRNGILKYFETQQQQTTTSPETVQTTQIAQPTEIAEPATSTQTTEIAEPAASTQTTEIAEHIVKKIKVEPKPKPTPVFIPRATLPSVTAMKKFRATVKKSDPATRHSVDSDW